jgi:hypothetical protein
LQYLLVKNQLECRLVIDAARLYHLPYSVNPSMVAYSLLPMACGLGWT